MQHDAHPGVISEQQIGFCGFYCGSCPSCTGGKCRGCSALEPENRCFCARCAVAKGIVYCPQCADFPCDELLSREKATALSKDWLIWKRSQRDQA